MQTLMVSTESRPSRLVTASSIDAVDHGGVARGDGIEPAATPRPAGRRAEFAAHRVQHVGNLGVLGRQRPFADARGVGLHHADDAVHAMRRDARAGAGAAGGRVRRRHERIRAVVDVQKSSLRAFEQNIIAAANRLVQQNHGVGDERFQVIARGAIIGVNLFERKRLGAERLEDFVVLFDLATEAVPRSARD